MRYLNHLILLKLFVFSQAACSDSGVDTTSVTTNQAQYLQVINVDANDTLNLRELPNGKSSIVTELSSSTSGMFKLDESKGWMKLSFKGSTGWAYGKYLKSATAPDVKSDLKSELFCIGTEPHWNLKTLGNNITFKKYDDVGQYVFSSAFEKNQGKAQDKAGTWSFSAVKQDDYTTTIHVVVELNEQCSDEMSDTKYTYSIRVKDNEMGLLNGCCK